MSLRSFLTGLCLCGVAATVSVNRVQAGELLGPGRDSYDRQIGTIEDDSNLINYELFRPPGHEAKGTLPLVVYLHGYGDGRSFKQWRLNDTMRDLVHTTQRDNVGRGVSADVAGAYDDAYASYLLVPKIPISASWYSRVGLVKELIDDAVDQYDIDSNRIYVGGFSNGAFHTLTMMRAYPDTFAAGVSFAGGGSTSESSVAALKDQPLWFFHDKTDPSVGYKYSENLVNALTEAGGTPKLTLYERGYRHDSWRPALADADNELYPWLFSQTVPEPTTGGLLLLGAIGTLMRRRRVR